MADHDSKPTRTFLDRAVGIFSPTKELERMVAREKLHQFAATRRGSGARGKLATAWQQGSSESWKKNRERIDAIWEAREMEESFCIISGLLQRLPMYICGTLEYQPQTGDGKLDRRYAEYFHNWCGRADYTGRHRLKTLAQLGIASAIRDGEHGWVERVEDGELRLQAIEGDRIGNPQSPVTGDETNINGIHIDAAGKVVSYEIYRRTRTVSYEKEAVVTPRDFIHLFYPTRTDQYHGVSRLAPALPHARDLYELLGHEKVAAKFAASFAAFVKMKDVGAPGAASWEDPGDAATGRPATLKAQAGTVMRMEAGTEDIEFAPGAQRPSGAFMALVEALIREIALALNLSYGFVYNMAVFGGVTARLETQAVQRVIRWYQERMEEVLLNRVRDKVLMLAIASGKLPWSRNWNKGAWRYGAAITGDVGHQTSADLELVAAGIKTRSQMAAEHGNDFRQNIDQVAAEVETIRDVAAEREVPMELLLERLNNPTALFANLERAKAGLPGPDEPPAPPPGLIGSVGDKGVKPLLELLEKVGSGVIDRDTGVLTVMKLYGMSYAAADKLVPVGPSLAVPPGSSK